MTEVDPRRRAHLSHRAARTRTPDRELRLSGDPPMPHAAVTGVKIA